MNTEQVEYTIENGEAVAPVSFIFKEHLRAVLREAVNLKNENIHKYSVIFLRKAFNRSPLYKKTSKEFQQEVEHVLNMPFPVLYEAMKGEPLEPVVNNKPKLKLVK